MNTQKLRRLLRGCALALSLFAVSAGSASALSPVDTPTPLASPSPESRSPFSALIEIIGGGGVEGATSTIEIILLITVLSLAPSILIMMTSFVRVIIILSFTRNAIGTQQMPPNQVLIGLALFLTFFIMFPVFQEIQETAWDPYEAGEIADLDELFEKTMAPIRKFMFDQIYHHDNRAELRTFWDLAGLEGLPDTDDDIPTWVLIPAFLVSEIKLAFWTGFLIFIPFIVIDMTVASILMSMGMMMLPPVMISLPFKIMLFMLVDGWGMVIRNLIVGSFGL